VIRHIAYGKRADVISECSAADFDRECPYLVAIVGDGEHDPAGAMTLTEAKATARMFAAEAGCGILRI